MPSQLAALNKIIEIFEKESIDYMLIGGWALIAYGQIRSTADVDFAITVKDSKKLKNLVSILLEKKYQILSDPTINDVVFYILDQENMVDIELWQKPTGITIDDELLERRQKKMVSNILVWIIGPEDLIINKLSREDRSAIDEQDIISILVRQKEKLDIEFLEKQAKKAGVLNLLETIVERIEEITK